MHLTIEHRTRYAYAAPVDYTIQQLRLTPQDGFGQRVKRWEIIVKGNMSPFADAFGNASHTLVVDTPHDFVDIIARGEVETDLDLPPREDRLALPVYLRNTPLTQPDEALREFAAYFAATGHVNEIVLNALMHGIRSRVRYSKGATDVQTTAAEAFQAGEGVCQDHAHIFIACCRILGVPARYVSGYLFTDNGNLVESHAWADAWLDGKGWQSFDVSNGQRTNGIHVRLASGLDYRDACPIAGIRKGGGHEQMAVQVQVSQQQ